MPRLSLGESWLKSGCARTPSTVSFAANSDGDDIVIFTDNSRRTERMRFPCLRQQWERDGQTSFRSLADYVAPREAALPITWGHLR